MSIIKTTDKLVFKVINICYQDATNMQPGDAHFFMEEDNWNDFGYRTTYHLHATSNITGVKNRHLGTINVMKKGQTTSDAHILTQEFYKDQGYFTKLPDNYCSISFSSELYLQLNKLLNDQQRKTFVSVLRMIFKTDSSIYSEFKDEECFNTSLLRDSKMNDYNLRQGYSYMFGDTVYYDLEEKQFTFCFPDRGNVKLTCDMSVIDELRYDASLPSGIMTFIGHNGSGKSTILYQMAKVLFAPPKQRPLLKDIIQVEPSDIGISKLLMFSYSAFDNFVLPGFNLSDYQLMSDGMTDNSGRFIYCGLRDVKNELDNYLVEKRKERKELQNTSNDDLLDETLERYKQDRQNEMIIQKPLSVLANEFESALEIILENKDKKALWKGMICRSEELLHPLFVDIKEFKDISFDAAKDFCFLSTGIKFFLHSLSHLIAYIAPNSLILFDEPENHLHPPLLSFMLGEFRRVIHKNHSVMLIATHSPVILQETFSKNVYIIKKNEGGLSITHPKAETFGETFGFINDMVFNLTSDMVNFYNVFDVLYDKWNCAKMETLNKVLQQFRSGLNCTQLSSQMTAYIVSKYMNKEN